MAEADRWKGWTLLRPGTYHTREGVWQVTDAMIDEIVGNGGNFDASMGASPVPAGAAATLGPHHNERGFKSPAMGSVTNVRKVAGAAVGDLLPVEPLRAGMDAGYYRYLSPEFKHSPSRGWYLHHVAALGTERPAMDGQRRLDEGEEVRTVYLEAGDGLPVIFEEATAPEEPPRPLTISEQLKQEDTRERVWDVTSAFGTALRNILDGGLAVDERKTKVEALLGELGECLAPLVALQGYEAGPPANENLTMEETTMGNETKGAPAPAAAPAAPVPEVIASAAAPLVATLSEADEARIKKLEDENRALRREVYLQEAKALAAGRVPAAAIPGLLEIYANIAEQGGTVKLAEADGKVKETSPIEAFRAFLKTLPPLVRLGEAPADGEVSVPAEAELTAGELSAAKAAGVTPEDFKATKEGRFEDVGRKAASPPTAAPAPQGV